MKKLLYILLFIPILSIADIYKCGSSYSNNDYCKNNVIVNQQINVIKLNKETPNINFYLKLKKKVFRVNKTNTNRKVANALMIQALAIEKIYLLKKRRDILASRRMIVYSIRKKQLKDIDEKIHRLERRAR